MFASLETADKVNLQPYTQVQSDRKKEIILHESDVLPAKICAVVSGVIQVTKTAITGKKRFFVP